MLDQNTADSNRGVDIYQVINHGTDIYQALFEGPTYIK